MAVHPAAGAGDRLGFPNIAGNEFNIVADIFKRFDAAAVIIIEDTHAVPVLNQPPHDGTADKSRPAGD